MATKRTSTKTTGRASSTSRATKAKTDASEVDRLSVMAEAAAPRMLEQDSSSVFSTVQGIGRNQVEYHTEETDTLSRIHDSLLEIAGFVGAHLELDAEEDCCKEEEDSLSAWTLAGKLDAIRSAQSSVRKRNIDRYSNIINIVNSMRDSLGVGDPQGEGGAHSNG